MPDDVQPTEGQGGEATDSGSDLYDLNSVDPEVRELLAPHLKAVEGNVTKKFQGYSEKLKAWEPYQELGLQDINPEEVKQLLDFAQLANDDGQFNQWLKSAAEERGLFNDETAEDDLGVEDLEGLSPEKVQEIVAEQMAPMQERFQAQEQEQLVQEAGKQIESSLEAIRKDNPDLPEGAEDAIVKLAYSYADENGDPIAKGFEDYQNLVGQGEKGLFDKKSQQPQSPEGPGAAATGADKITSFSDPRLGPMAREKMRNAR